MSPKRTSTSATPTMTQAAIRKLVADSIAATVEEVANIAQRLTDQRSFNSKEDLTQKISTSVFVTNFPDHCTARDLWNVCLAYGKVVDVYIPFKKSKDGKKFVFVRFLKVDNLERLIGVDTKSFAFVLKHVKPTASADLTPAIVLDDSCILEKDLSCAAIGKIKDISALSNLYVILNDEGFGNVKLSYLRGFWVLIDTGSIAYKEKLIKHVGVLSWFSELGPANNSFGTLFDVDDTDDASLPFKKLCVVTKASTIINDKIKIIVKGKIYWIRIRELEAWTPDFDGDICDNSSSDEESVERKATKEATQDDDPSHPSGFTPKDDAAKEKEEAAYSVNQFSNNGNSLNKATKEATKKKAIKEATQDDDPSHPPGFKPNDVIDKVEEDVANSVNQPDTNVYSFNNGVSSVKSRVNRPFNLNSGGSIMDVIENLVNIRKTMGYNMEGCKKNLEDIVASHGDSQDYITHMIDLWDGECIILGDFNEVRSEKERFGTIFNNSDAKAFNHFISTAGLIDLPLEGYSYTWAIKSLKMSKLDRFLVSEGLLLVYPSLSSLSLDRHLSDHRPIIMREAAIDYRPSPFRVYHSWFAKDGFDKLVDNSWKNSNFVESSKITLLRKKFQALKASIKAWCKEDNQRSNEYRVSIQSQNYDLDKMFDNGISNEDLVIERTSLLKDLHNINIRHSLDMAQKAKIRWSIEGDENSKFFHGDWIDEPYKLSFEQNANLEYDVSYDEIKRVVRDYGTNKSPGPDGFTFDFIRTYWKTINQDVANVVREFFFSTSKFPPGSNSSFITLIPEKQDAKLVKDFRPISLIGSFYKIIAKILANHLSMVISDLISDVQSAFVSNRQILDGPFILNELLSWCKYHKTKAMIFKVDFEKVFDSVRWDYLDGILTNFGFAAKWRWWIQGCLTLAMGSILVNGSPTSEFKFHKGLKQGDPLSPFLFILVMESLHLLFNNILNAGLFKGIRMDESLTLSHLFYADDAVFIGKWDKANVVTIVHMLKCFFLAAGLQINIHKSTLMGIGVSHEEVKVAANIIGCSTFSTPFNYLGVKRISFEYPGHVSLPSPWNTIIKELGTLSSQGIRLHEHLKKKNKKQISVAEKLSEALLIVSFRRAPRGGMEEEQFLRLVDLVASAILSNSNNRWVWLLDSSGEYSVSLARSYIDDLLLPTVGSPTRWVKVVPIKINIFAWKVCLDKLPTRLNLSLRGIDIPSIICPICSLAGESCSHILFSCSMARLLWRKVVRW
ncbi:RNA-directed DNA polymerase, eukaryota [Tanacetum coccineum]|uniref:RNA-directed DNA polymerase, eukaryota n=1 Tax=Tanacetum coccineum TaxID=301880 RepID=A0ABQ4YGU7_9ASTR